MPSSRLTIALLAVLTLGVGTAESATRTPAARDAVQVVGTIVLADGGISLNQAISMVERRFKARVVRSDVRQEGERKIYVLRLLDDAGNAQVVRVDASSGAIL
jgi:uncharacterized membrane protein YkoI